LRDHVQGTDNNPLLIFPEGTCVNNNYTVMFKKVCESFAIAFDVKCNSYVMMIIE
jgi:1-acyl-sn-glycerol-3-phosphate acyltransferase